MTPGSYASAPDPNQVIAGVLDSLRQSRTLLLDPCPQNIDCCRVAIAQCVNKVGNLMEGDRAAWNGRDLKASLLQVRGELGAIAKLLDSAAAFRRDMLKVISGASRRSHVIEIDAIPDEKARRVHVLG
jgi:hypothetical protein